MDRKKQDITRLLNEISNGSEEAYAKLFPIVYDTLRDLAYRQVANEPTDTYTKTALVHELYLKLLKQKEADWEGRNHFFAIAARCMRQILIDHARKKKRVKRGGKLQDVTYIDEIVKIDQEADNLIQIDEALIKLGRMDQRLAKIVELHYFGEMSFYEIAKLLSLSERTVYRDWAKARGWLYKELKKRF
jgi:RNA polymerase sigma factor (TIGR02999 family)